jgi:predicted esterase
MTLKTIAVGMTTMLACAIIAAGSVALASQAPAERKSTPKKAPAAQKTSPAEDDAKSILTNGGLERGDAKSSTPDGWSIGAAIPGVTYKWDRTVAHQGRASLHLRKTERRYFPIAQWFQEVRRTGDQPRLKVTAFVKAKKATKAILDVQFVTKDGGESHEWAAYIGAKQANDPPVTHDWKRYEGIVTIPEGTEHLIVAAQIYGPGDVWFDDFTAEYTDAQPAEASDAKKAARAGRADEDVADVPAEERRAGDDPSKRYFLIGPVGEGAMPAEGYRLLVVLPGGDGGDGFHTFVKRIAKFGLPAGYLVAQPVAVAWTSDQFDRIVWPTANDRLPEARFTTEAFVDAVIADVRRTKTIDPRYIFTLGWSSGGPPTYATALGPETRVTGSFVAMSVFHPGRYSTPAKAKGRGVYILHSPEDFIPIAQAEAARDVLKRNGAKVELRTYEGGHGWHGDVYGEIRRGVEWLERNHAEPAGG